MISTVHLDAYLKAMGERDVAAAKIHMAASVTEGDLARHPMRVQAAYNESKRRGG